MHRGKVPPQAAQLAGKVPLQAAQLAAKAVKTLDDDEGTDDERLEAAETLMELATDVRNKAAVRWTSLVLLTCHRLLGHAGCPGRMISPLTTPRRLEQM